jgi:hypothetical protein
VLARVDHNSSGGGAAGAGIMRTVCKADNWGLEGILLSH